MTKFNFKKKYGQNFLKNEAIIDKIVSSINPTPDDLIIEIGPGAGAITKKLKIYNAQILAFEIDEETEKYLAPLEDNKTKVIYKDFLSTDIKQEIKNYPYKNLFIIGNLPYYITTPIIEHIIDSQIEIKSLTIMVQKEVADRLSASLKTKDYGYMTVLLNYQFDITRIVEVGKDNFQPKPKVDSSVIQLTPKTKIELDYQKFKKLLKDSFQFKRKTIANNLFSYDKKALSDVLKIHGYNLTNRAEEIDLQTFIDLARNL